jgi:alkylated DNA repair dioxygenase AlkB
LQKGKCGEAPIEIKMELNHGDLVVMHGENLQKYYEVDGSKKPRTIKETILTLR